MKRGIVYLDFSITLSAKKSTKTKIRQPRPISIKFASEKT